MASRAYHINLKGDPGLCRATKESCPFGGEEAHHPSEVVARASYEKRATTVIEELAAAHEAVLAKDEAYSTLKQTYEAAVPLLASGDLDEAALKAHRVAVREASNELRDAYYEELMVEEVAISLGLLEREANVWKKGTPAYLASNKEKIRTVRTKRDFETKMDAHMYRALIRELQAWSGLPREAVKKMLRGHKKGSPLSKDAYVVSLFQQHRDTIRDRVFVDIETTSLHPTMGEIIEIGLVRTDPQGNEIERYEERYDMTDERVRTVLGTGPVEVHGINPEDVAGKRKVSDEEVQALLKKHLADPNVIVIAHNAPFEQEWFEQYVDGFHEAHSPEAWTNARPEFETTPLGDTRTIAMFLAHGVANTKLESFAPANGVPYRNAHQAMADAEMTYKTLEAFEKKLMAAPLGERPEQRTPPTE